MKHLSPGARLRLLRRAYGRRILRPAQVRRLVEQAVAGRRGFSVIRLGDVMGKLLTGRFRSLRRVARFLGISPAPDRRLVREVRSAVRAATVVGVSHFPASRRQIRTFMRRTGWRAAYLTDAFVNDQLFREGHIMGLIRKYRVALIGRAAPRALQTLKRQGLWVPLAVSLDHHQQVPAVLRILGRYAHQWDLALVGASVPGRVLCVKIARALHKPAVEIGHIMDALAWPKTWSKKGPRKRMKLWWMRRLARQPLRGVVAVTMQWDETGFLRELAGRLDADRGAVAAELLRWTKRAAQDVRYLEADGAACFQAGGMRGGEWAPALTVSAAGYIALPRHDDDARCVEFLRLCGALVDRPVETGEGVARVELGAVTGRGRLERFLDALDDLNAAGLQSHL